MARQARKRSNTGIYHVILRGIDRRDIFLDEEDKAEFLKKVIKAKGVSEFELYGYCLMDNHVHLLLRENEEIGKIIKRITVGYVHWHNIKYGRMGHLYQNRYMSEPVEKESYLLNVLRYIHQNPVKAGMVEHAEDYRWSSYCQYIYAYHDKNTIIDAQLIKAYLCKKEDFNNYMNVGNDDECLELKPIKKYTDAMLKNTLQPDVDLNNLKEMSINERNKLIKEIYQRTGVSVRQLARVLGIGKNIIERAVK